MQVIVESVVRAVKTVLTLVTISTNAHDVA